MEELVPAAKCRKDESLPAAVPAIVDPGPFPAGELLLPGREGHILEQGARREQGQHRLRRHEQVRHPQGRRRRRGRGLLYVLYGFTYDSTYDFSEEFIEQKSHATVDAFEVIRPYGVWGAVTRPH